MKENKTGEILDYTLLKRIVLFAKPYKSKFIIAAVAAILLSFLGPIRPLLINFAVDNYIVIKDKQKLFNISMLIFGLLVIEGGFQFFYIYISTWLGQHVIQDLRVKIFKHIVSLNMRYFDKTPIGTLVTRSISDIETISDIFSQGLLVIIAEILKLIIVIIMMFYTNVKLSLITMLTIPFLLLATSWFKRSIKEAFQDVREQISRLNTFVQEHIVGMNIVQIFNRENAEFHKFYKINQSHRDAHLRSIFYYAVFFPLVEIISALSIALVVWYGGRGMLAGQDITVGELIAFVLFIYMMFRPIRQLADRFNILQMGIVGAERGFRVLDTSERIDNQGNLKLDSIKGKIVFDNVKFSYKKDEWVFRKLSFSINSGETLALVGKTGSGKTSIASILNRLYEIQEGRILIDDLDITDIRLTSLRDNIALVQQDVFLFSETILNNIILFDSTITRKQVIKSAKLIGVHDFIESLPGSYEYIVGERGLTLSAGQRQLIAFLRVYLRNPGIIILDEATSSIDSNTENMIQNALHKIAVNRTTIIIAHRLSTIIHADKILHIDSGKVIEEGTHKELMNKKGSYYHMYNTQSNV